MHTAFGSSMRLAVAAGALGFGAWVAPVSAQVSGLVLQYQGIYAQTSVNPPASTTTHQFSAFMTVVDGGTIEVYEVELWEPDGSVHTTSGSGTFFSTDFFTFSTRALLMSNFPNGAYKFVVVDGEPSGTQYTLQQASAAGVWPAEIPAFTAATYQDLQGMNPAIARPVTVNTFTPTVGANGRMYGLAINQRFGTAVGPTVWSNQTTIGTPVSTMTVPANALQPNTTYYASWIFDQRVVNPPPAGVQYTQVSFGNITRAAFTTGPSNPCPPDIGRQGGIVGSDGHLDNNDFVVFIDKFFTLNALADFGRQGGIAGHDGLFDNNDFVVFINQFFAGC